MLEIKKELLSDEFNEYLVKNYGIEKESMNNSIQEATESSLKCIVQAMLREGIVNVDDLGIKKGSNLFIPIWENKKLLFIDSNKKASLSRYPNIGNISVLNGKNETKVSHPDEFINILMDSNAISFDKEGLLQLRKETNNSIKNHALTIAFREEWNKKILKLMKSENEKYFYSWAIKNNEDSSLFLEQWGSVGHPYHPGSKTKLGFSTQEVLKFSPEFKGGATVHLLAVKKDIVNVCTFNNDVNIYEFFFDNLKEYYVQWSSYLQSKNYILEDYIPIPIHHWQYENIVTEKFKNEIENGEIFLTDCSFKTKATMSFRTVVPSHKDKAIHIKLPVAIQATSAVRTVSPASVNIGPSMSSILMDIEKNDSIINKYFSTVPEYMGIHFKNEGDDRQRHLSVLFRENPSAMAKDGEYPIVVASLLQKVSNSDDSILIELIKLSGLYSAEGVLEYFNRYTNIVINAFLRLYLKYGISLEAHQQNTLMVFDKDGNPIKAFSRDFGGVRVHRPTLLKAGFNIEPIKGAVTIRDDKDEVRNKLLYTTYQSHIGEVILHLCEKLNLEEQLFWDIVLKNSKECFFSLKEDLSPEVYSKEFNEIFNEDWNLKSLTKMRLDDTSHDYIYTKLVNPIRIK